MNLRKFISGIGALSVAAGMAVTASAAAETAPLNDYAEIDVVDPAWTATADDIAAAEAAGAAAAADAGLASGDEGYQDTYDTAYNASLTSAKSAAQTAARSAFATAAFGSGSNLSVGVYSNNYISALNASVSNNQLTLTAAGGSKYSGDRRGGLQYYFNQSSAQHNSAYMEFTVVAYSGEIKVGVSNNTQWTSSNDISSYTFDALGIESGDKVKIAYDEDTKDIVYYVNDEVVAVKDDNTTWGRRLYINTSPAKGSGNTASITISNLTASKDGYSSRTTAGYEFTSSIANAAGKTLTVNATDVTTNTTANADVVIPDATQLSGEGDVDFSVFFTNVPVKYTINSVTLR